MKTILKTMIVLLIFCNFSYSQQVTWQRILEPAGYLHKVQQIHDGNYVAVGSTWGSNSKIVLIKFNQIGDTLWKRILAPQPKYSYNGFWVEETYDNGFIICGDGPGTVSNGYLIKTDSNGIIDWYKSFGGADLDQAYCVRHTNDLGFVITMRTTSFHSTEDIMIVKTDSLGNLQWQKIFDTGAHDNVREVCIIKNSGYIVIGTTTTINLSSFIYLLRIDLKGDTLWTRKHSIDGFASGASIDTTIDNGFIIGGTTTSQFFSILKSCIIKTDSLGFIGWKRVFTGNDGEEDCKTIK